MKKILFLAPLALLAMASCDNENSNALVQNNVEMSFAPTAKGTKGYSVDNAFYETQVQGLHNTDNSFGWYGTPNYLNPRVMNISAYLYPQEGENENYFVGKTFKMNNLDDYIWRNFEGETLTPIYWPIAGKLDFLAYSLTQDATKSVTVEWNKDNAASQVVLNVPGENTQNDILFSSLANTKQAQHNGTVNMTFDHAQAWLEFVLTGAAYDYPYNDAAAEAIELVKIELEDVYNAGKLTIDNNGGDAVASWDFSGIMKRNIEVDNVFKVKFLSDKKQYLDILLPQQQKKDFVLYYKLKGNDANKVLKYRFDMDEDSWLMGYKYIYTINITTNEITVVPTVTAFVPVTAPVADIY